MTARHDTTPTDAQVRDHIVEVGGIKLRVRETGPREGVPVLIITGIGCNVEMFAPFQDSIEGRRTIAFDAPGIGRSDAPNDRATIGYYASVAARLAQTLTDGPVDVVGYSFGGTVAQQLAHDFPYLVRRMVLVATTCGWGGVPGDPIALGAMLTPLRFYSRTVNELTQPLLGPVEDADPVLVEQQRNARAAAPPTWFGYWAQGGAFCAWSSWRWLDRLTPPTLVVVGEFDRLIPPGNGQILAARIPQARLHVVPGQGHHFLADPDVEQVRGIRGFLEAADHTESDAWITGRVVHEPDVSFSANPLSWPMEAAHSLWRWICAQT